MPIIFSNRLTLFVPVSTSESEVKSFITRHFHFPDDCLDLKTIPTPPDKMAPEWWGIQDNCYRGSVKTIQMDDGTWKIEAFFCTNDGIPILPVQELSRIYPDYLVKLDIVDSVRHAAETFTLSRGEVLSISWRDWKEMATDVFNFKF